MTGSALSRQSAVVVPAPRIGARSLKVEHDEDDPADERQEDPEQVEAAVVGVVEATHAQRQSRHDGDDAPYTGENRIGGAWIRERTTERTVDTTEDGTHEDEEWHEPPEFRAGGSPVEHGIVLEEQCDGPTEGDVRTWPSHLLGRMIVWAGVLRVADRSRMGLGLGAVS